MDEDINMSMEDAANTVLRYIRDEMGSPNNQATAKLLLLTAAAMCRKYETWEKVCALAWKLTHPETVN